MFTHHDKLNIKIFIILWCLLLFGAYFYLPRNHVSTSMLKNVKHRFVCVYKRDEIH